ncbi:hypothetical protein GC177_00105 [bacterium]|nr:hypothetical protein [bacterium]
MLNQLWAGMILLSLFAACMQTLLGHPDIWPTMGKALFESAKFSMDVALGLAGIMCLWMGFFAIAEQSGLIQVFSRLISPLLRRLMPEVPHGHPSLGSMSATMAANMLGLDNAATPFGLKAMIDLQTLNKSDNTASNAQIMFLVINTASVVLLPVTVMMYRQQMGSADPAAVFLPLLLTSIAGTIPAVIVTAHIQRIKLLDPVIIAYGVGIVALGMLLWLCAFAVPEAERSATMSAISNGILMLAIAGILIHGMLNQVPVYEAFIEGAKEGFHTAIKILPYLVAMIGAIAALRACGLLTALENLVARAATAIGLDPGFVPALPTAFMKPFSGSAARASMLEVMQHYGVDSFPATVASMVQGSTETTFYVMAVYFGSVGITRVRYAAGVGLFADFTAIVAAIYFSYVFFG